MNKIIFYNIKINENNFNIEGYSNWTILQACEKIGLYIPRFCYNETLSIAGNCRMCLVEIEKTPKLMPACAIQTTNEMKIKTKTNLVKKTRESILEFLLINHPLDCPICDQGGECDLQDQAMIYGSDRGRFYEYKRAVQDKNAGPLIKTIMTRCIHCTRCIRFATEIAGIETYGTTGRGEGMEVGTYINKIFDSELSGNVIDLCPVGALTSKPYAFKVRPWELKSIETIDILDSVGTNIRVDIRGSEIMRILPRTNGAINEQWISDKTRFAYDGLKNQRIKYPMFKTVLGHVTISWKEAIEYIREKIIRTKEEKISLILGQFIDLETTKMIKRKANEKGIDKIYLQEQKNNWENIDLRENYLLDLDKEGYETILIGTNPRREATIINIRLRRSIIKDKSKIKIIGGHMNLTYENEQIGKGIDTIYKTILGKNKFNKELLKAQNPIIIMGTNIIQRKDGKTIKEMLNDILEKWKIMNKIIKKEDKGRNYHNIIQKDRIKINDVKEDLIKRINILHKYANTPCALEVGIGNNRKKWKQIESDEIDDEVVYSIGADIKKPQNKNGIFEIYQGHHGNICAKEADIILPSTTYIEKKGTYINTEGLVQKTQPILEREKEIYDDCVIIEEIWNWTKNKNENESKNKDKETIYIIERIPTEKRKIEKEGIQKIINRIIKKNSKLDLEWICNKIELEQNLEKVSGKLIKEIKLEGIGKITNSKKVYKYKNENEKISLNKRYNILYNEDINTLEDNYYLSDIITRASITMAKCSASTRIKQNSEPNFQI